MSVRTTEQDVYLLCEGAASRHEERDIRDLLRNVEFWALAWIANRTKYAMVADACMDEEDRRRRHLP